MSDPTHPCPDCGGYTFRVRRRYIDRLISLFKPVRRYQCQDYNCMWRGNILVKHIHFNHLFNENKST